MDAEERERRAEETLDAMLARYSSVQPRAGLEQRILANLEARQRAQISFWRWGWAVAAAVLVISAGLLWVARHRAQPAPASMQVHRVPPPAPAPAQTNTARALPAPSGRIIRERPGRVAASGPGPRRNVFPSPVPLTSQEIAAIRLAKRDPNVVQTIVQVQELERQRVERLVQEPGPR